MPADVLVLFVSRHVYRDQTFDIDIGTEAKTSPRRPV